MFTPTEAKTLKAALNRIIPADDLPDAVENGCYTYIERLILNDKPEFLEFYQLGLASIDRESRCRFALPFPELGPSLQDEILAAIEQSDVLAQWTTYPANFFLMLCDHAAEGYYGDPGNGSNQLMLSWKMIGFDANRAWVPHS